MEEGLLTGVSREARNAIVSRVGALVTTVWDFSLGAIVNLIHLGRNAEKLKEEMSRLQDLKGDLSIGAELETQQPMMMVVTNQVSGWINRVDNLGSKVTRFQESLRTRSICVPGFCLGNDAVQLQTEVEKLMEEGRAFPRSELVRQQHPNPVQDVPLPKLKLVGTGRTMMKIQGHIMNDSVGVIGIWGMGGAGKTTLLNVINNKFLPEEATDMFNLSILVTVSRTVDILSIQNSIGVRLGLNLSSSRQGEPSDGILRQQQAETLFMKLSKKRFILFLDDIWEKIDLMEIGIPWPDESNKCKILFTTRSEGVCADMDADEKVKVGLLDPVDSWTLFQSKMGKTNRVVNNPHVRELAEKVVAKCGGLPISLVTVGRAMATATTIQQWSNALHELDKCKGMEQVLNSLKFSFEMLKKNTSDGVHLQSCLLYCVFYPEDRNIPKGEIIDYWISEGFLDPTDYIDKHICDTRDRGHSWIGRLQSACLLEDGNDEDTIRLHDTIRDMLLGIGRAEYMIFAGDNIAQIPKREIWERAKGISLMDNNTSQAPSFFGELRCKALTTLIVRTNFFPRTIQKGFFGCTGSLRVLDLTYTGIEALPSDITTLVELRYLSLQGTKIASLPEELGKLTNLRYLNLKETYELRKIPREAVSRLTSLQVLNLKNSNYNFSAHSELRLSDLENLGALCELSAKVKACSSFLHDMAVSSTFSRCIRELDVELYHEEHQLNTTLTLGPGHFPNLKLLQLFHVKEAEIVIKQPIFERLQDLKISWCLGSRDLTWVGQLPLLERIEILYCEKITELVLLDGGDLPNDGRTIFPSLKFMRLYVLPSLRSISNHVLLFPSLEELAVFECPNLKRLPFGPESAKKLRQIRGFQDWWDGLEWDQPSAKSYRFEPYRLKM